MKKITGIILLSLLIGAIPFLGAKDCAPQAPCCIAEVDWLGDGWEAHWLPYLPEGDPLETFSVKEGVLRISGIPNGYIRTKQVFHAFRMSMEWRWPEEPGNSGVLVHINGPDKVWPLCIEAQMRAGNAGDIVLMGTGSGIEVDGVFKILSGDARFGVIPRKPGDYEKAPGEWNRYEIVSEGTSITFSINGEVVNAGTNMTLNSGFIGIQSEGKPLEVRNFRIELLECRGTRSTE
jgi:hypothetical protein